MNKIFTLIFIGFVFIVSSPAFAGSQQDKMRGCNKEAKKNSLKGDERKAFMSKCLKKDYKLDSDEDDDEADKDSNSSGKTKKQKRMKSCEAKAESKSLEGKKLKKFMKKCLKKSRKKDHKRDSDDGDEAKKKPASPAQLKQRNKMRACNAKAKSDSLKGNERKKFMSKCLKKGYKLDSEDD